MTENAINQKQEWSDAERYRPYSEYGEEYADRLRRQTAASAFLPAYHIRPRSGLLNDPNGFSHYQGEWRLFYQAFPYGAVHGLKSWEYVTSPDLIHWTQRGRALSPDTRFDDRGVYSGSALATADGLYLFYTGNAADEKGRRLSCQMRALMSDDGKIRKDAAPVISAQPPGYTAHFRDPQAFRHGDGFRMLVGAQRRGGEGAVLVYRSADLREWRCAGELRFTDRGMGHMIECPNLVFVDGRPVFIFCPQGLDKSVMPYENIYPNAVLTGEEYLDESNRIAGASPPRNLDDGFEFYAAQAINAPDGRVLAVGWIGLPDVETPTETEGWAHCLSLVRELRLHAGKIYGYPAEENEMLRGQMREFSAKGDGGFAQLPRDCYELELLLPPAAKGAFSLAGLAVRADVPAGEITVDRSAVAGLRNPLADTVRTVRTAPGAKTRLNIFIDRSVFEIFVNRGEKSITGRFFPAGGEGAIAWKGSPGIQGAVWEIADAIGAARQPAVFR